MSVRPWLALLAMTIALRSFAAGAQHEPLPATSEAQLARLLAERPKWPIYRDLPAPELDDWVDPSTGSSTRSAIGCAGLVLEATLSGDRTKSYVTATLFNASSEPMRFTEAMLSARFGDGAYRKLGQAWDRELAPGAFFTTDFAFRDKAVFEDQRTLELALRVRSGAASPCTLGLRFQRSSADQDRASYTAYHTGELSLGLGMRLAETGGPATLRGGSRVSFHLDFAGFLGVHHGLAGTLMLDQFGSGAVDRITPRELGARPHVSGGGFLAGYIGRIYLAPWLTTAYHASAGPYVVEVTDDSDEGPRLSTAVLVARQRVRLAAQLLSVGEDWVAVGASFEHLVIPYGKIGDVELRGHTITAKLELIVTN